MKFLNKFNAKHPSKNLIYPRKKIIPGYGSVHKEQQTMYKNIQKRN